MDDGRNSSFKASSQEVEKKMSWSQTEDNGTKKKSAESFIKVTVVSCERMQMYLILTHPSSTLLGAFPHH